MRSIIDCTAEQSIADRYAGWLERGIHVITPNKKASSGPIAAYEVLQSTWQARQFAFLLRNNGRRRITNHFDAAGPDRYRRYRAFCSGYFLRNAGLPV